MNTDKKEKLDQKLAAQIRETREKKGLTQAEVARQADVTETFYAMTERGETNPSYAKLKNILNALGLQIIAKKKQ